jgi:5-methylthioadenosine/S-adenosylhomocysteine deaminase
MTSILLRNGYVVTVDPDRRVFPNGYVRVDGEWIASVGPMDRLAPAVGDEVDEVLDVGGKLVIPGLINLHDHHFASLFKGFDEGEEMEPWLVSHVIPISLALTPGDLRIAAYISSLEMLRYGVTCSVNHLVSVNDADSFAGMARAGQEVGVRQILAKEVRGTPDPPFSTDYPAYPHIRSLDEEFALAEEIVRQWHGKDGVVHVGLATETGAFYMLNNTTSAETIHRSLALADKYDLRMSNHAGCGSPSRTIPQFTAIAGGGEIDYLRRLEALSPRWLFVHDQWFDDRELDLIAEAGASMAVCTSSGAFRVVGIAPLRKMLARGINVGLGTDGAWSAGSLDVVQQMRITALVHNALNADPTLVTAERAIEMATVNAAAAVGLQDEIGSLEVGKRADISVFDVTHPPVNGWHRPVSSLVFSATGADAHTVLVNGRVQLLDGQPAFSDEAAVHEEARAIARTQLEKTNLTDYPDTLWRTPKPVTDPDRASTVAG